MELLDRANTETYGTPVPVTVPLKVEKGPFIVITGHDLKDLKLLLEQTEGKGINIYTHGEMLPAHAYPELKKYPHLKGNYGTAWQNQQKEFADLPAPILFTTNCLMPVKESYADRVFTTEVVSYPGMVHIGEDKDFTPVIEKALELGGFAEDQEFTGINGGHEVTTGFGHGTVLSVADKIIDAVKRRNPSFLPGRRLRRSPRGAELLYRICQEHTEGYGGSDPCLRKIPIQRSATGNDRGTAADPGYGTVQRRLQRDQNGGCSGGGI